MPVLAMQEFPQTEGASGRKNFKFAFVRWAGCGAEFGCMLDARLRGAAAEDRKGGKIECK